MISVRETVIDCGNLSWISVVADNDHARSAVVEW
jgi:hypothetical protein